MYPSIRTILFSVPLYNIHNFGLQILPGQKLRWLPLHLGQDIWHLPRGEVAIFFLSCTRPFCRPDEEIVYGLVDQPMFFSLVHHTVFYFGLTRDKVAVVTSWRSYTLSQAATCSTWADQTRAWLWGPGWFPGLGLPRLGDNQAVPQVGMGVPG